MPQATYPQPKTIAGRAARDALIVARRAQDWTFAEIAEEHMLSEAQVKKIVERERKSESEAALLRGDPVEIVENVLADRQRDYSLYTHAAMEAAEKGNLNALIGALNGRGQTSDRIVKLLQDTGKLPRELGTMRYVIDFRGIAREMARQLEAVARGEITAEEAISYFREITHLGAPGSQIPTGDGSGSAQLVEATVVEDEEEKAKPATRRSGSRASRGGGAAGGTRAAPARGSAKKSSGRSGQPRGKRPKK